MDATVTGDRENKIGNRMEVPCKFKVKGPKTFLSKAEYIYIYIYIIEYIISRRQTNL